MTAMQEMIERLENAEPGRELDCRLAAACGWVGITMREIGSSEPAVVCWHDERGLPRDDVPNFTSSVDAALTLMPAAHYWSVSGGVDDIGAPRGMEGMFSAGCWPEPYSYQTRVWAQNPALALCIAILKARQSLSLARPEGETG